MRPILDVHERPSLARGLPLSLQHLLAMFGATVLVPFLLKVDPSTALLMNGIGTLLYLALCRGKIPAYLGSSFAFIAPVAAIANFPAAQGGFIAFGLFFLLVAAVVRVFGTRWLEIALPPAAMAPVVAIIGLELLPVAAGMAGLTGTPDPALHRAILVTSLGTLAATVLGAAFFRGFFAAIPIVCGVFCGYGLAAAQGLVDLSKVIEAPWLRLPAFSAPIFDLTAILMIAPAALVVLAEHVGHLVVTGEIVGKDLVKDPGLGRSLFADGLSNVLSGAVGATPNTTYGENIGVMAMTRVYSVWVIGGAAVLAILVAFCGKLAALIQSIPVAVMGGVCLVLFGVIAVAGVRLAVERKVDYGDPRNLTLTATVFALGLSGAAVHLGGVEIKGMALAALVGVTLSLVFALRRGRTATTL